MPAAVPFVSAFLWGASATASAGLVAAATLGTIVQVGLINVALSAASRALAKRKGDGPPVNITINDTVAPRYLIFGTRRVGGVLLFDGLSSSSGKTNNLYWFVVALAGHQCEAIGDIYIDGELVTSAQINGSGDVTSGKFAGKLRIFKHLGTGAQAADSTVDAAFTEWTSAHRLQGTCYIAVCCEKNDTAFPSGPPSNVSAIVSGLRLYDPRLDSTNGGSGSQRMDDPTTWTFSRNGALAARWYLTGGSVVNDQTPRLIRYGVGLPNSMIDDAVIIASANVCDETLSGGNDPPGSNDTRYQTNLLVSADQERGDILQSILGSFDATMVEAKGKVRIVAGAYQTPVHTITQDDLYGDLEIQDTDPHAERYNQVSARFIDAAALYQESTTIFQTQSSFELLDNGEPLPLELNLPGVTDQYQAQRLAYVNLLRSRMQRNIKLVGGTNLLKVALNENIQLTIPRYGWVNRIFKCTGRQFEIDQDAGRVSLTCVQEDSAVYTDLITSAYTTGSNPTVTFQIDGPATPAGFTVTPAYGGLIFAWTPTPEGTSPWALTYEIWEYSTSTPFSSATKIAEVTDYQVFVPKLDLTQRFYWLRARSIGGQISGTTPAGSGLPAAALPVSDFFAADGTVVLSLNGATKPTGAYAWDSQVRSLTGYVTAHVQFKAIDTGGHIMVGLNSDPTSDSNYTSIDYAWYVTGAGTCQIYESGVPVGSVSTYTTSTVFAVTYNGTNIVYKKNGEVMRTVAAPFVVYYMDSSFYTLGGGITGLHFGVTENLDLIDSGELLPGSATNIFQGNTAGTSVVAFSGTGSFEIAGYGAGIDHALCPNIDCNVLATVTFEAWISTSTGGTVSLKLAYSDNFPPGSVTVSDYDQVAATQIVLSTTPQQFTLQYGFSHDGDNSEDGSYGMSPQSCAITILKKQTVAGNSVSVRDNGYKLEFIKR